MNSLPSTVSSCFPSASPESGLELRLGFGLGEFREMIYRPLPVSASFSVRATKLARAEAILERRPALGVLVSQTETLREELHALREQDGRRESKLTPAELRLLPLLSTRLSFREIGERLHVSRNTVKTQAIAVYRKLGVSSRDDAIDRAAALRGQS